MCGIFGIVLADRLAHTASELVSDLEVFYRSAMLRGQDATGLAVNDGISISVLKRECEPIEMIKETDYKNLLTKPFQSLEHAPL